MLLRRQPQQSHAFVFGVAGGSCGHNFVDFLNGINIYYFNLWLIIELL